MTARLEVERIVADWLCRDINTRLATVPVDTGDPLPPPIAAFGDAQYHTVNDLAVFDSTRHFWVTERKQPPAVPALYVQVQGPIMMMGEPYPDGHIRATKAPIKLAIRYLTQNADAAAARRDGCYTMRAVARSLRELSKNEHGDVERVRNQISVVLGEDPMEFYPVVETVGNARVAGALVVHFLVRDGAPSY